MYTHFCKALSIGAAVCLMAASALSAQTAAASKKPAAGPYRFDVAVTYGAAYADVVGGNTFWMQGGSLQGHVRVYRSLGVVADFAGLHKGSIQSSGVGIDLVTTTFGPRYTWRPAHARYAVYAQALGGLVHAFNSEFPASTGAVTSASGSAVKLGGGFNFALTPHIGLRVLEADWLRTQFSNSSDGAQDNLQLNTGVILRF